MYTPHRSKQDGRQTGRKFGGRSDSWQKKPYDRTSDRAESYAAVCSECGKDCRVPFRPNGKKPVLCTNCFKKDGHANERSYGPMSRSAVPAGNDHAIQEQLRAINAKLDAILKVIESSDSDE
jgi:CxxC-x17-CxxC domain-containing protein